jgi:hypothetical protein
MTELIRKIGSDIEHMHISMPDPGATVALGAPGTEEGLWAVRGERERSGHTERVLVMSQRFDPADGWQVVGTLVFVWGCFSHIDWTSVGELVPATPIPTTV